MKQERFNGAVEVDITTGKKVLRAIGGSLVDIWSSSVAVEE